MPAPLQNDCGWYSPLEHDDRRTARRRGRLLLARPVAQSPVLPHEPVFEHRPWDRAGVPAPTFEHVPAPFRLHVWQVAQLPVEQQTPSVQWLLAHWLFAPQAAPFAFLGTQLPGVLVLPCSKLVLEHCVSAVQLVRHVVPLQT